MSQRVKTAKWVSVDKTKIDAAQSMSRIICKTGNSQSLKYLLKTMNAQST